MFKVSAESKIKTMQGRGPAVDTGCYPGTYLVVTTGRVPRGIWWTEARDMPNILVIIQAPQQRCSGPKCQGAQVEKPCYRQSKRL